MSKFLLFAFIMIILLSAMKLDSLIEPIPQKLSAVTPYNASIIPEKYLGQVSYTERANNEF